ELLEEAGVRIEPRVHGGRDVAPRLRFPRFDAEAVFQHAPALGPALTQQARSLEPALQVPLRHHVGVGAVVHVLVVLVGPDDVADVVEAVLAPFAAARPEAGRLQPDLRARVHEAGVVARGTPVLPTAARAGGADR